MADFDASSFLDTLRKKKNIAAPSTEAATPLTTGDPFAPPAPVAQPLESLVKNKADAWTSRYAPEVSEATPARAAAPQADAQANTINVQDFLNSMGSNRAALPDLPTYTPHEKHGFGERVLAFFRGAREGGLASGIEYARDPGQMEYQQFLQKKYMPALAMRNAITGQQDAQVKSTLEMLKGISGYNKDEREGALNQAKFDWEKQKPVTVNSGTALVGPSGQMLYNNAKPATPKISTDTEFALVHNDATGQWDTIPGPDGKPLRSRQYLQETLRQMQQNLRGGATNQNRIDVANINQAGQNYRHDHPASKPGQNSEQNAVALEKKWAAARALALDDRKTEEQRKAAFNEMNAIAGQIKQDYGHLYDTEGQGGWSYVRRKPQGAMPQGDKTFPAAQLEKYARAHNSTPEEARRFLEGEGFIIK